MADPDLHAIVQRMIDAGESEENIATVIQSAKPKDAEPFAPTNAKDFLDRMGKAAIDVPIGALKNLGRAVQMVPGVTAATDKVYGLPAGASAQSMQPTNAAQTAGGYVGDAALIAATGGAEVAGPVLKAGQLFGRPTVAELGMDAIKSGASFAGDTVKAIGAKLATGPVTAEKVADLVVKYGKDAVRAAVIGGGGYGAWTAVKHLLF